MPDLQPYVEAVDYLRARGTCPHHGGIASYR
jgi:hypothetical protein